MTALPWPQEPQQVGKKKVLSAELAVMHDGETLLAETFQHHQGIPQPQSC